MCEVALGVHDSRQRVEAIHQFRDLGHGSPFARRRVAAHIGEQDPDLDLPAADRRLLEAALTEARVLTRRGKPLPGSTRPIPPSGLIHSSQRGAAGIAGLKRRTRAGKSCSQKTNSALSPSRLREGCRRTLSWSCQARSDSTCGASAAQAPTCAPAGGDATASAALPFRARRRRRGGWARFRVR